MRLNDLARKVFLSIRLHGIETLIWHLTIRMACKWPLNGMRTHKQKHSNCIICCKNCYISFSVLKADDEIKVRRRIFTLNTLIYVQHIMRILRFSLILLVSILFIVSNRFLLFRLMKFTMRKNRLNTVYASDNIQHKRLPVSLKVGRIYF